MTCPPIRRWDPQNGRGRSQSNHGGHYRSSGYISGFLASGRHEWAVTRVVIHFLGPHRHLEIIVADAALLEHPRRERRMIGDGFGELIAVAAPAIEPPADLFLQGRIALAHQLRDRTSTRLHSSH